MIVEDRADIDGRFLPAARIVRSGALHVTGTAESLTAASAARSQTLYIRFGFKRALDIIIASAILLFVLPVTAIISIGLLLQDGLPLFYSQPRVGLGGRWFRCLKFRTMSRDAQERLDELLRSCSRSRMEWDHSQKLRDDPRIHPVGRVLRKSSLDELPQLLNVLRGDMSIVGPRPIMSSQIEMYGARFEGYVGARPGLTGLWQVSGRNALSFQERVALDARYLQRITFVGDMKILFRTVWVVLIGHGSC